VSRMTAAQMALLRWTFDGPHFRQPRLDETYFELRVKELPDFVVLGESVEEVLAEVTPALEAFLQSYLDAGEQPPLPEHRHVWMRGRPSWPSHTPGLISQVVVQERPCFS
jgi:predicted RNase H-like HicB family nuclease